MTENNVIVLNW